jgi:lysophospholipase L1-like esterase
MTIRVIPNSVLRLGGGGLQVSGASGPSYLLRDVFTTDADAPLTSPRACEPGPGTLTLVQTDGQFSIATSKFTFPAQVSAVFGDQVVYSAALHRVAGRVLYTKINRASGVTFQFGWWNSATFSAAANQEQGFYGQSTAMWIYSGNLAVGPLSNGTEYELAAVLRANGMFLFQKGGTLTGWTLVWVAENIAATAPITQMYPALSNYNAVGTLDDLTITDLPAPYNTEYGLATDYKTTVVTTDTINQAADGLIEFTWVCATGETVDFMVRRTDDTHCWIMRCSQSGSTVKLIEVTDGETERASAAQTFTNAVTYRLLVICAGNTIAGYVFVPASSAVTNKFSYASAAYNNTATGVKVAGFASGRQLIAWPRSVPDFAIPTSPATAYNDNTYMTHGDSKADGMWQDEFNALTGLTESVRIAHPGYTQHSAKLVLDAELYALHGSYPRYILINFGANDLNAAIPLEATWKADLAAMLDALHTKYAGASIYVARAWTQGHDADADTLAGWTATVVAARAWAGLGIDERVVLKGSDDGATMTSDGTHPTAAGEAATAAAWRVVMGV